jgi:signal recognition particle GTPase
MVQNSVLIRADSLQFLSPKNMDIVRRTSVEQILNLHNDRKMADFPTPFTKKPITIQQALQNPTNPEHKQTTIVDTYT